MHNLFLYFIQYCISIVVQVYIYIYIKKSYEHFLAEHTYVFLCVTPLGSTRIELPEVQIDVKLQFAGRTLGVKTTRWGPYQLSMGLYPGNKWPYTWVNGIITL